MPEVLAQHTIAAAASGDLRKLLDIPVDWPVGAIADEKVAGATAEAKVHATADGTFDEDDGEERKEVEERHREPEVQKKVNLSK